MQVSELDRDRIPPMLSTFVRHDEVFRSDWSDKVVLEVVDEAVGNVVDRCRPLEGEGRSRLVRCWREHFLRDEFGQSYCL